MAIRVNIILFAIVTGLTVGTIFLVSTYLLIWQGGTHKGAHLSLFSIFFPGYSVTAGGAWFGFFWAALYGGASGAILYAAYARTLVDELTKHHLDTPRDDNNALIVPVARLSGHALGVALGMMVAIQLFLSTNWLVLRGTAESSRHAALLANFLPGYSVSFLGSLAGCIELFVLAYVLSRLLCSIYNRILDLRLKRKAP